MEIRRSQDRLISTMGFPILVRCHLYIESGPSLFIIFFFHDIMTVWMAIQKTLSIYQHSISFALFLYLVWLLQYHFNSAFSYSLNRLLSKIKLPHESQCHIKQLNQQIAYISHGNSSQHIPFSNHSKRSPWILERLCHQAQFSILLLCWFLLGLISSCGSVH